MYFQMSYSYIYRFFLLKNSVVGQINEEQFMRGVGDLQQNELAAIVQFEIFPPDMRDEFHRSIPEVRSKVMHEIYSNNDL